MKTDHDVTRWGIDGAVAVQCTLRSDCWFTAGMRSFGPTARYFESMPQSVDLFWFGLIPCCGYVRTCVDRSLSLIHVCGILLPSCSINSSFGKHRRRLDLFCVYHLCIYVELM